MVILIQRKKEESYLRLIEASAIEYLPVRYVPFAAYIQSEYAASLLQVPEEKLIPYIADHDHIHGVLLESGQFFVHPDGFLASVSRRSKRALKKAIKETQALIDLKMV